MSKQQNGVKRLAKQMAAIAWEIRDHLLPAWGLEQADTWAQTICYEQFALWLQYGEPATCVEFISEEIETYVRKLQNLLNGHVLVKDSSDLMLYFYEELLRAYDRETRERRGVYYTPQPLVTYLVQSVDALIRSHFCIEHGLAGEEVEIVDPAVGTGTFLHGAMDAIEARYTGKPVEWAKYVRANVLPRLRGMELMRAPHAIAHTSLRLRLAHAGVVLQEEDVVQIDLANALDGPLPLRNETSPQVLVMLGNPPYSNFGKLNHNAWIDELIGVYKQGLVEKKQNLSDDYIKFIRLAEWQVEQAGRGIVAFVTNNSFLFGLTHRKMRESLLRTFDVIYVLNLHGDQSERYAFAGDENVFNITRGVAVVIFVRHRECMDFKGATAQVFYQDLVGSRDEKFAYLAGHTVETTSWQRLQPRGESYEFVPMEEEHVAEYEQFWSLSELFLHSNSGIQTKKDRLAIHFDEESLDVVLERLRAGEGEALRAEMGLGRDSSGWRLAAAVQDVRHYAGVKIDVQYRPFDTRKTYYTGRSNGFLGRPRADVTEHLLRPNLALASLRQIVGVPDTCAVLATKHMLTDRAMNSRNGTPYVFPLYRYGEQGREHNLNSAFLQEIERGTGLVFQEDQTQEEKHESVQDRLREGEQDFARVSFDTEDVFAYLYAVLNANGYRERYVTMLRRDFPRVPAQVDADVFLTLVQLGKRLVHLHTDESDPQPANTSIEIHKDSNHVVRAIRYDEADRRLYYNATHSIANVPPAVYQYRVGGYQVVLQWLKERRGRSLSARELAYLRNLLTRIEESLQVIEEIDEAFTPFLRSQ